MQATLPQLALQMVCPSGTTCVLPATLVAKLVAQRMGKLTGEDPEKFWDSFRENPSNLLPMVSSLPLSKLKEVTQSWIGFEPNAYDYASWVSNPPGDESVSTKFILSLTPIRTGKEKCDAEVQTQDTGKEATEHLPPSPPAITLTSSQASDVLGTLRRISVILSALPIQDPGSINAASLVTQVYTTLGDALHGIKPCSKLDKELSEGDGWGHSADDASVTGLHREYKAWETGTDKHEKAMGDVERDITSRKIFDRLKAQDEKIAAQDRKISEQAGTIDTQAQLVKRIKDRVNGLPSQINAGFVRSEARIFRKVANLITPEPKDGPMVPNPRFDPSFLFRDRDTHAQFEQGFSSLDELLQHVIGSKREVTSASLCSCVLCRS